MIFLIYVFLIDIHFILIVLQKYLSILNSFLFSYFKIKLNFSTFIFQNKIFITKFKYCSIIKKEWWKFL